MRERVDGWGDETGQYRISVVAGKLDAEESVATTAMALRRKKRTSSMDAAGRMVELWMDD